MVEKTGGKSPSRDIAISTRVEPSRFTRMTDVNPASAAGVMSALAHVMPTCANASATAAFSSS
jgi:hypothetical protein